MKAVIIYQDLDFAGNACAILRRAACRAEVNVEWTISCWPANALNKASFFKKALLQARDAHLILLPARLAQSISGSLRAWLRRWAMLHHIPQAALGIVRDSADLDTGVDPDLAECAREHGLVFIGKGAVYPEGPPELPVHFDHAPETSLPVQFHGLGESDSWGSHWNFGIND
jgi:hypothetical protein